MQQAWLKPAARHRSCPALMRKHGIDMWVVSMREYNEDPVFSRDRRPRDLRGAAPHDLRVLRHLRRRRPGRRRRRACSASRSAAPPRAGSSTRGAHHGRADSNVGRGQQAELWGDDQWQALKAVHRGAQPQGHRHQPLDRVRLLRRAVERRAAGHERAARREMDGPLQGRRGPAARAHRRAPARRRGVLHEDAGAGVVDDRRRCSRPRRSRPARPAPATWCGGGGSASNDLGLGTWFQPSVEVQRQRRHRRRPRRRPGHPARRRAALRRRHHRGAPQHRHPAHGLRAARGRDRRAGRAAPGAGQLERAAGHHARGAASPAARATQILAATLARIKAKGIDGSLYTPSDRPARPRRRAAHRAVGLPGRRARARRRAGHPRACGSRSSCRRRRRCRNGAASACAWRRKRTRSSTPPAGSAGRCGGRTACSW